MPAHCKARAGARRDAASALLAPPRIRPSPPRFLTRQAKRLTRQPASRRSPVVHAPAPLASRPRPAAASAPIAAPDSSRPGSTFRRESTLKAELVEHERYPTRAAAIAAVGGYIDDFDDLKRRHSRLAYMSPIELELRTYVAALAAS
ncbi:IS3 family transposase [Sorangium sp. So ce204]|uniref:IS3 family transposase n=1 Tax=Sorangium sp. So ce204 TaxID=3133288 RepID=UPI003F642F99